MTDFYNKYKELFDGEVQAPSDFNFKSLPNVQQYGGLNYNAKEVNIKEFKQLFDDDLYQPKKMQFDSGYKQNNYYQDSLDAAQLLQQKKNNFQYDDANSFGSKKPPLNLVQKDYLNSDQYNKIPQYGQEQRQNSRQSLKRDTLAANAERLLQQDFSSYNRNISSNRLNDQNSQYENQIKNNNRDNFQKLNQNSSQQQSSNFSKPPFYQEKFDSIQNRSKDNIQYSPVTSSQQQYGYANANQGIKSNNQTSFFNSSQDQLSQNTQKQRDLSPVINMSKQRKYQELYGSSNQYQENKNQNRQQDKSENIQQQQQTQSPQQPRQRNQVDNVPKQYFEERNQGLLDIIHLKKKFIDHKIITDTSGFPGYGQYKQALVNRINATKNMQERKDKLKQLFKIDRVF